MNKRKKVIKKEVKSKGDEKKVIKFPFDVMTVTIPKHVEISEDGKDSVVKEFFLDVKEIDPNITADGILILSNIGFYYLENDVKVYTEVTTKAELRVKYPAGYNKNSDIKLVYWTSRGWKDFPGQVRGVSFVTVETPGWPNDPSIGWR